MIPHSLSISDFYLTLLAFPYTHTCTLIQCIFAVPMRCTLDLSTLFIFLIAFAFRSGVCFRTGPPVGRWVLLIADELDF